MHLTEEQLQRLLHGEELEQAVRVHVEDCLFCRDTMERARKDESEIFGLLASVDRAPPEMSAEKLASLARDRRKAPRFARYRWAAVILMALALGGVAYAFPGSPFRTWLERIAGNPPGRSQRPDSTTSPGSTPVAGSGVAVDPGGILVIVFEAPPPGAQARVTITDGTQVVVQASIGRVRFVSETDRLQVTIVSDSTLVEIQVPRAAPRVEIVAGNRRVWVKNGEEVTAPPVGADTAYLLPLAP